MIIKNRVYLISCAAFFNINIKVNLTAEKIYLVK